MKYLLLIASVFIAVQANAQHGRLITEKTITASGPEKDTNIKPIYSYVEQMPTSGYDFQKYLKDNIHYPDSARAYNIQGRVIVKYIVNDDGSISDCTVVRGIDPYCDAEAVRVISNMPNWKPARQDSKAVRVWYTLPIVFRLE